MKDILAVGEYLPLLETRAAILAKTGARVMHCSASELPIRFANERFDLVVLCYTIREDARGSIMSDVRRRWPFAQVVQIITGYGCPLAGSGVDAYVPATEPARLVQRATELLGKAVRVPKLRVDPPPGALANLCFFYSVVIGSRRSLLGGHAHPF